MKRLVSRALLGAGVFALALSAPALAQDTVKIGVITDKTGPSKYFSELVLEGITTGAKEINDKGGVLGKKVELLIEDDQTLPELSATKARKLVDSGVVFILSITTTPAAMQSQQVSLASKTPHMMPAGSGDTATTTINNPYFWQMGPLASMQIATLMSYTKNRKFKRAALISDNTELSQLFARIFKQGLEKAGVEVVVEEVIQRGASTAVPQMQKVRAANPDSIFQASILGPEVVLFFKAYHQLGLKQPILGSYNLAIPSYLTTAKDLMDGATFVDAYDPEKEESKKYVALWQKEHKQTPGSMQLYGYDGIHLAVDAIRRAGSLDKEKVREAMQATTGFKSVLGAKGCTLGFKDGKRTGFDPNCAVIRIIEKNAHGRVVHVGAQ
ncbi:MAG: ABC transporter substrate-binding protein [Alphaproteobacteria bacterium]